MPTRRPITLAAAVCLALAGISAAPAAHAAADQPHRLPASVRQSPAYNGLAPTPPMGWNDWSYYQCNISEALILKQAKALVTTGLAKKGYNTVTIDDCWMAGTRAVDGSLQANPKLFPDGMAYVANKIHAMGLKFGIYEDAGTNTCGGYPGSWGHYTQDADTFASWGVDYVKLDGCNVPNVAGQTAAQTYVKAYDQFSKALVDTGREIVFSDSAPAYFQGGPDWQTVIAASSKVANLWREGADTALGQESGAAKWSAIAYNYSYNVGLGQYAGPGHFNDPDFLLAGDSGLSDTEMQSQVSLWAEMAAPLISSTDLTQLSAAALSILGNARVVAVDQDALGAQGHIIQQGDGYDVLTKPLANGDVSVVLFNKSNASQTISTTASAAGAAQASDYRLTDLVTGQSTASTDTIAANVPAHGTVMYRVHAGASSSLAPALSVRFRNGALVAGKNTPVSVTVTNNGPIKVNAGSVQLSAPSGWTVAPNRVAVHNLKPGQSTTRTFQVSGVNPAPGPRTYALTATMQERARAAKASYAAQDDIYSNLPYPNLAAAYNNVGVTTLANATKGNFDGGGNSFSEAQLEAAGVTPGSTVSAGGTTFTWPDAAPGTADNVQGSGATITTSGQGSKLGFLGSEAGDVQDTVTVTYTDGSTSTGQLGFPNWSFSDPSEFGSQVAISVKGRNTQAGYADSAYDYRVFYNSIPLDAGKQVASVTLPTNAAVHIFAMEVQK
ncbi:NEW3 domain-containing protein [Leekyejoonella antrihumi]|uniref:Alpha-galactosidase n=1 Tax=Leekyejoonella antrihumi TaxID=1660198 RepID=A0A563DVT9_9MICO|nr:NEW3 domain-containing protein [Leekyejoonella antrihumi]TWP34101.1 hypothetical protein FGL98_18505 [Leekyejoonella antrihumi]